MSEGLSRRGFLKLGLLGGVGAALAGPISQLSRAAETVAAAGTPVGQGWMIIMHPDLYQQLRYDLENRYQDALTAPVSSPHKAISGVSNGRVFGMEIMTSTAASEDKVHAFGPTGQWDIRSHNGDLTMSDFVEAVAAIEEESLI